MAAQRREAVNIVLNQTFGDEEFQFKTADRTSLTEDRAEILEVFVPPMPSGASGMPNQAQIRSPQWEAAAQRAAPPEARSAQRGTD